jgi:hypothetical protein
MSIDDDDDLPNALSDADLDATWNGHDPAVGHNLDEPEEQREPGS